MDKVSGKLTVFFEEPFWVGMLERVADGKPESRINGRFSGL